jgi:hypothetical protein
MKIMADELSMTRDTIQHMKAAQSSVRCRYTEHRLNSSARHVYLLSEPSGDNYILCSLAAA